MRKYKVFNITATVLFSMVTILLAIFVFSSSYLRFWESLGDLWTSVKFYFLELFDVPHEIIPTVDSYSKILNWDLSMAEDWNGFKQQTTTFFDLFFSKENFVSYWKVVGKQVGLWARYLTILLPCFLLLFLAIKKLYESGNTKHNHDTKALKCHKWLLNHTYEPIKRFILEFINYLKRNNYIYILWIIAWIFSFNLASIIVSFFAYYFFFAMSFKFETIYVQVCKLFIDLKVIFNALPWWVFVIIALVIFDLWRKKIAQSVLRHYEARNCGFINELPIVSMTCGSMGKKKTTVITDMALSQEVMFRQKALDILQKTDMKFPYFPWICFEKELEKCFEFGTVYNLATAKAWVQLKRNRYEQHNSNLWQLYGYDTERYSLTYNDGLKTIDLFDALETYAQAYLIYIVSSSLIVSNYSIRTDNLLTSEGNFPMWVMDFFYKTGHSSTHSHILDFDVLRLGKKLVENNPNAGSFEFGVIAITEIGKERGNMLDHKETKKNTSETNQKNDLFNSWLKMCRHSATVDNFPFIKVFTDEQRPESWGADARDLCDIIHIVSAGEQKLALPFYTIEEMLTEWVFNKFISLYYDFRFRRGDNTFLVYVLKSITAWLWKRNVRMYNNYGYSTVKIEKERGTMDSKTEKKKYFLMNKKIYSQRFSTDCFSDYFNEMAKNTNIGLNDYMEYATEKASVTELKMQNSYFINALYRSADSESSAEK